MPLGVRIATSVELRHSPSDKGGVGNDADLDAELGQRPADKIALVDADQFGEDLVGVDDAAVAVAMDDEVAQRVDQAAESLLAFLQLPHAVGERLDLGAAAAAVLVEHRGRARLSHASGAQMHERGRRRRRTAGRAREDRRAGELGEPGKHDDGDDGQRSAARSASRAGSSGASGGGGKKLARGALASAPVALSTPVSCPGRTPRSCEIHGRQQIREAFGRFVRILAVACDHGGFRIAAYISTTTRPRILPSTMSLRGVDDAVEADRRGQRGELAEVEIGGDAPPCFEPDGLAAPSPNRCRAATRRAG